jgi:hypothetical protein
MPSVRMRFGAICFGLYLAAILFGTSMETITLIFSR